eukprot:CAMPEP_0115258524 /NCGR_PEP_ID=MMETSP0270-20121206/47339_1 /TAXON_ID=71861 /ORGANISM="Scrippsiella trochoidea, Strain CCMP3099" /LENGTH=67 /DNA_ID=CAMNT_0002674277 /DNA_START=130 /DNA_END=329 /DNA_ORIENTATION=+
MTARGSQTPRACQSARGAAKESTWRSSTLRCRLHDRLQGLVRVDQASLHPQDERKPRVLPEELDLAG